jgi:hypothetical protein
MIITQQVSQDRYNGRYSQPHLLPPPQKNIWAEYKPVGMDNDPINYQMQAAQKFQVHPRGDCSYDSRPLLVVSRVQKSKSTLNKPARKWYLVLSSPPHISTKDGSTTPALASGWVSKWGINCWVCPTSAQPSVLMKIGFQQDLRTATVSVKTTSESETIESSRFIEATICCGNT